MAWKLGKKLPVGRIETQWKRLPEVASLLLFENRLKHGS